MTHRHYGIPVAKPRPTYSGPTRAAAWSGGAIVGAIIAVVIVLGFVVYEVSKIVTHAGTRDHVSAPHDRRSKPSTVEERRWRHDRPWTRQHWINAAQPARLLRRRSGSCMERSCVRSHHSGHRCCSARHLVRPRRVSRKMPSG